MSSTSTTGGPSDDSPVDPEFVCDAAGDSNTGGAQKEVLTEESPAEVIHKIHLPKDEIALKKDEVVFVEGEGEITVVTEDNGEDDDGENLPKVEKPEGSSHVNITSKATAAFVEAGSVVSELKTAFREVESEIVSAVCEVKREISHVLTKSSQPSSASLDPSVVDDSSGDGGVPFKNDRMPESSEASRVPENQLEKVVVPEPNSSHVKSDGLPLGELEDAVDSRVSSEHEPPVPEDKELHMAKVNMNVRVERSTEVVSSVNRCSDVLHSNIRSNIAVAEEVTEDLLKDEGTLDSEKQDTGRDKDISCVGGRLTSVQSKQGEFSEVGVKEGGKLLTCVSEEQGLKIQPLSAPSTPVPSASNSARKVLRSQGCRGRRVSFPEDETHLISSYLEPVNPWRQMGGVTAEEIATAYRTSCERHRTQPLPGVLQQIKALPLAVGGRVECLSLRGQRLDSSQCEGLEEIFRRVQFKILDLEGCSLDDDSAIPLFDMIEFYDSATQLNISCNSKIGFRGWQACSRMLKRTPSVEYLDARNTNLNETNMPILGRALRLGARLHTLHLENCNLTGRPLIMLTAALRQNDTLCELYLAENRLGVNDCIQLGNLVRANSTLRLLDLRNNNVQDVGCGHVCEGIAEQQKQHQLTISEDPTNNTVCKGLNSLVLWNNHLTQQSASHLAGMLSVTRALETLNLGRNNLTSEGILRLKESLLRNHALLRLGLQAARIADEGAVALAEYTADNTVIQHIDLRDNPIRVAGLMALAHSLRLNSTIIQMDIDSDPRTEPAAELIEQYACLQKEIKEYCKRNLTQSHLRTSEDSVKVDSQENSGQSRLKKQVTATGGAFRKISLTCDTPNKSSVPDRVEGQIREEEKQKYVSPAPSPLSSPSPSPCASPSPSPVPSPLKNRFRVFRVQEASKSSPDLIASASQSSLIATSVPVYHHGRSLSAGDLSQPPKQMSIRPNRFGIGGRFTVTRVAESSGPCSLPTSQEKVTSFTSSSVSTAAGSSGPKIVISSPVRVERGFSVDETSSSSPLVTEKTGDGKCDPNRSVEYKSVGLPENKISPQPLSGHFVRLRSDGDSDDVFVDAASTKLTSSPCQRPDLSSQRNLSSGRTSIFESHRSDKDTDSVSSSDLTDSGFLDEGICSRGSESASPSPSSPQPEGDRDSLLSSSVDSTNQEDNNNTQGSLPSTPLLPCTLPQLGMHVLNEPLKRAPLASMENGSFDSDSEDSELTTQSSDSTHSDEVRITTEQYEPKPAWGAKQEQVDASLNAAKVLATEGPGTG